MLDFVFMVTFVWFWCLKTFTSWIPKVGIFTNHVFMAHEFVRLFRVLPIRLLALSKVKETLRSMSDGSEQAANLAARFVEFTEESIAINGKFHYYSRVAGYFQMYLND